MSRAYMQYEGDVVARWHGGEYIDIGWMDEHGEYHAYDAVNVWDYEAGKPRIPVTLEAFQAAVDAYLAETE